MAGQETQTGEDVIKDLKSKLRRMGVSPGMGFKDGRPDPRELQLLYWQANREQRDARMWWIAVLSAVASVLSSAAAWYAVVSHAR